MWTLVTYSVYNQRIVSSLFYLKKNDDPIGKNQLQFCLLSWTYLALEFQPWWRSKSWLESKPMPWVQRKLFFFFNKNCKIFNKNRFRNFEWILRFIFPEADSNRMYLLLQQTCFFCFVLGYLRLESIYFRISAKIISSWEYWDRTFLRSFFSEEDKLRL